MMMRMMKSRTGVSTVSVVLLTPGSSQLTHSASQPLFPPDSDLPQRCQAAALNHTLFLFARAGSQSGGVWRGNR